MPIRSLSRHFRNAFYSLPLFLIISNSLNAQIPKFTIENGTIREIQINSKTYQLNRPLVSFQIDKNKFNSSQASSLKLIVDVPSNPPAVFRITFQNTTRDTLQLQNVIPFAPTEKEVFITGKGNHRLSRTHLFLPGRQPVNVIVPDNAWELGYAAANLEDSLSIFGLTRRDLTSLKKTTRRRFEYVIAPGGSVSYLLYADAYYGRWQTGLRKCFQEKKLYDLNSFDERLYRREDLHWIQKAYVMHLMMAWDKDYYDGALGQFNWAKFLQRASRLYGGDDVVCLWPTWPTLGLDPRNQFDMYRDLPGGLKMLRAMADTLRKHNTKFFIAYNPWDESTRSEGHLQGLADLSRETSADGVVLDTQGESSMELQLAADNVKLGVIMYSEGMAVRCRKICRA